MKFFTITILMAILFSSCLKESIPDAMLNAEKKHSVTATLSYKVNGDAINISVDDADNQNANYYTLGCSKLDYYSLTGLSNSGEFSFVFYTTNLTVGNYNFTGAFGDFYMLNYNGENEYVHAHSDSLSLNITSYTNGHISGNFSGVLTPLISAGTINNIFGEPGSILITDGVFENVPVF